MELEELKFYGEPGALVYRADCIRLMSPMPAGCVDAVFTDPPYRLSRGGVTVRSGRLAPVDKGSWDRSRGFARDHAFNVRWLRAARRVLRSGGSLWVSGTHHVIFSLGFALQTLNFRVINTIVWEKPDPPPNALRTAFTQAEAVDAATCVVLSTREYIEVVMLLEVRHVEQRPSNGKNCSIGNAPAPGFL